MYSYFRQLVFMFIHNFHKILYNTNTFYKHNTAKMAPKTLNFITGNKNKLTEVEAILGDTVDLKSQKLDLVEIQGTIEEISADKCRRAADAVSPFLTLFSHYISLTHV